MRANWPMSAKLRVLVLELLEDTGVSEVAQTGRVEQARGAAELPLPDETQCALQVTFGVRFPAQRVPCRSPVLLPPLDDGRHVACSPCVEAVGDLRAPPPPAPRRHAQQHVV